MKGVIIFKQKLIIITISIFSLLIATVYMYQLNVENSLRKQTELEQLLATNTIESEVLQDNEVASELSNELNTTIKSEIQTDDKKVSTELKSEEVEQFIFQEQEQVFNNLPVVEEKEEQIKEKETISEVAVNKTETCFETSDEAYLKGQQIFLKESWIEKKDIQHFKVDSSNCIIYTATNGDQYNEKQEKLN